MNALKENSLEIEIGSSVESFQKFLNSQRELFHSQVEQLQNVVVTQCRLTGVNPLSQEMAAGALSIKIGKRPRDLVNPKALKYMQEVFSVKDAISQRGSREISGQFGVTVTQVKDFFASQRSIVRKLVRLSRERAIKSNACKEPQTDGVPISSDSMIPIDLVPLSSASPAIVKPVNHFPLNYISPLNGGEVPSCSARDDSLVGMDDLDKHFIENIFSLMRKEETFSGQVKLMERILQIENSSVLFCFLSKGGVMILATWLSQAVDEEQTSVLSVILDVFSYLPLHKASPEQMSAILQSVKRLRFHRASDISNRARTLLLKWSKMFATCQALKKPNGTTNAQNELILKQGIGEIMADESWQSNNNVSGAILALHESSENFRKLESPQALKLLTAAADDSARKNVLGISSSYNREHRKVQFVEHPGQKMSGRSPQATRATPLSQARPMSADDIQKAKLRAMHMQNKYGKTGSSSNGNNEVKTEGLNKSTTIKASILPPVSRVLVRAPIEEHKKPVIVQPKVSGTLEAPLNSKQKIDIKEPPEEKCERVLVSWQAPSEVKLNVVWRVGAGENSKEIEVQKNRIHREKEAMYHTIQEIPFNPNKPWDLEMDYDDTLTLEIPTEQPPDACDSGETLVATTYNVIVNGAASTMTPISSQIGTASTTEPDLELLAVLLKNPELVFALTSGRAGNLSNEDTLKLLDMIKARGAGLPDNINGIEGKVEEKVEVSLPSPTPSSIPGTSESRREISNSFSRLYPLESNVVYTPTEVASPTSSMEKHSQINSVRSGISDMNVTIPQHLTSVSLLSQQVQASMRSSLSNTIIPERQQPSVVPSLHQSRPISSLILQTQTSEIHLHMLPVAGTTSNFRYTTASSTGIENLSNSRAAPIHNNAPKREFSLHASTPIPIRSQPQHHFMSDPVHVASSYSSRQPMGNLGTASDSRRASQRLSSNHRYQIYQTNYNASSFGGPVQQPHLQSCPRRERNGYASNDGFESWSPENSPTRPPPEYISNIGWRSAPDRSGQWNSSGYRHFRDCNKNGNTWRDGGE